jgi:hypothetical protein
VHAVAVCLRLVSQSVSLLGGAGACHHHHHQHQQGLDVDQAGRPAQGKARRAAPRSQGRNIRIGWVPSSVSKAERAQGKWGTHGRTHGRRVTRSKPLAALTDGGWAAVSLLCEQLQLRSCSTSPSSITSSLMGWHRCKKSTWLLLPC